MVKLATVASFLIISLLFGQFVWLTPTSETTGLQRFDEKINLALRRTGHHLLLISGDSTSRIPVVRKLDDNIYILQLGKSFDYNQLPALLQESFALHKIKSNYDVAVVDCKTGELQLGYNFLDYTKNNEVPCGGREQGMNCYHIKITFPASESNPKPMPIWWTVGIGLAFICVLYIGWRKKTPLIKRTDEQPDEAPKRVHFGESSMDLENQLLYVANTQYNLTYREAKLLQLFVKHPNQVLERDFILKSVWEDEGIIVGRSVDVFVSRLRKMLHSDPTLRLMAVHGVGYRLEINSTDGI